MLNIHVPAITSARLTCAAIATLVIACAAPSDDGMPQTDLHNEASAPNVPSERTSEEQQTTDEDSTPSPRADDTAQHGPLQDTGEVTDDPGASTRRPIWLGTRILPLRDDGFGQIQPTPPELRDRQLPPPSTQQRAVGDSFEGSVGPVPADVLERSTWAPHCPVAADDLALVHVTFWSFDAATYRGELLVHVDVADHIVQVFRAVFDARFPIEEMRIIRADELGAAPTGDGNITTAFECREPVTASGWSQHAYGLAIDINPFHNPYVKADLVIPELASAYIDRSDVREGMIMADDGVTAAFADIGWGWGGDWRSVTDPMHFSLTGR